MGSPKFKTDTPIIFRSKLNSPVKELLLALRSFVNTPPGAYANVMPGVGSWRCTETQTPVTIFHRLNE